MTTTAALVTRVRSNLNEPSGTTDPQRTDAEIAQWLTDGMYDYVAKVPADAFPELVVQKTFTGTYWGLTSDFQKLLSVIITHTITGSTTATEVCKVLDIDEAYVILNHPAVGGAWAKFDRVGSTASICVGPAASGGTVTCVGLSMSLTGTVTFPMDIEHEEPIVNYATAMALGKVNDTDAERYLERYEARVAAENGQKYPQKRKVEKVDPS